MNEIWIDINGYEGLYQISNLGQVKSFQKDKEKILSLAYNNAGYLKVILCKNGTKKTHLVHQLVAHAFVPGYREGLVVNHIDENKSNNHASNLEWVSQRENTIHGTGTEKRIRARQANKGKSIYCPELNMTFKTQTEASRYFGCSHQHISKVLSGERNGINGYHLEFR